MSAYLIGWIVLVGMFFLLALRVPVAVTMIFLGVFGIWALQGPGPALGIAGVYPFVRINSYTLTTIPLFILMGNFVYQAGFAADVIRTAKIWLGRIPGGLIQVTIVGAAAFGAACGSGMASCSVISKITLPEMLKIGVDRKLVFGAVATVGTLAVMIPPSITMVIYGIITEQSIGKLLIAGIFPGIVATFWYMLMIFIKCKRNPELSPPFEASVSWKEKFISLKNTAGILVLFVIVIGGIYAGIFTPTEAGGIGCFVAFILGFALRRLSLKQIQESLVSTVKTTGMVLLLLVCAIIFNHILSISRIPNQIVEFIIGLNAPHIVILIAILLFYILLGFVVDVVAMLYLTLPIVFPLILSFGYDPIWFGVLIVHIVEMGMVTPPFGLNIFVMQSTVPDMELRELYKGIMPFVFMMFIVLATYIVFPQISLFLPNLMK